MTNVQVSLIGAASTDNLDVNVGITIIFVSGVLFLVEYVRCQR